MSELTNDELTVLQITAQGESLAPIGRWEKSIRGLAAKGLLRAADPLNYVITDAGKKACAVVSEEAEDALAKALIALHNRRVRVRDSAKESIELAAKHLADAARASAPITGDSVETACRRWHEQVLRRALELLNG